MASAGRGTTDIRGNPAETEMRILEANEAFIRKRAAWLARKPKSPESAGVVLDSLRERPPNSICACGKVLQPRFVEQLGRWSPARSICDECIRKREEEESRYRHESRLAELRENLELHLRQAGIEEEFLDAAIENTDRHPGNESAFAAALHLVSNVRGLSAPQSRRDPEFQGSTPLESNSPFSAFPHPASSTSSVGVDATASSQVTSDRPVDVPPDETSLARVSHDPCAPDDIARRQMRTFVRGLYIHGPVGCGKTRFASIIARELILLGHSVKFISLPRLFMRVTAAFDEKSRLTHEDVIESFVSETFLIVDDLGVEKRTEFKTETVYQLVDWRKMRCLATILTSNLSLSSLRKFYSTESQPLHGDRIASRIAGMCDVVEMRGPDYRMRALESRSSGAALRNAHSRTSGDVLRNGHSRTSGELLRNAHSCRNKDGSSRKGVLPATGSKNSSRAPESKNSKRRRGNRIPSGHAHRNGEAPRVD